MPRRRVTRAANAAGGRDLRIGIERRQGPPTEEVLRTASDPGGSLVVVAADPPPRWLDVFRPALTSPLIHHSRDLVVVTPRDHKEVPGLPPGSADGTYDSRGGAIARA